MNFRITHGLKRATRFLTLAALLFTLPAISTAQRWDNITAFPLPTSFGSSLNAITTGPDGNLWFTDNYQNIVGNVTTAGVVTEYFSCCGNQGITTGPDGALWFGFFNGVGRVTTTGSITEYFLPVCCGQVSAITAGPDGNLWFTEGSNNKIGRITTAGVITEFFIANSNPIGIVAGPDGNLWFTEQQGNRIGRITTAGTIIEFPLPSCCGPSYITAGQDHALWFTETGPNKIGRITTKGVITEYPLPTANSGALGISGGPDGAVWFTEQIANKIGRITSDGSILEYPLIGVPAGPTAITTGPDSALWFTEPAVDMVGRAPACGLDLSLTLAGGDLTMNFVLGTTAPSSWGTYLLEGSTLTKLWSRSIPAVDPPRAITKVDTGLPSGSLGVFSLISDTSGGLTCYDLQLVNATAAQAAQIRKTIVDSGLVNALP